jgi:hypothetical protein
MNQYKECMWYDSSSSSSSSSMEDDFDSGNGGPSREIGRIFKRAVGAVIVERRGWVKTIPGWRQKQRVEATVTEGKEQSIGIR